VDEGDPAPLDDVFEHAGKLTLEVRLVALRVGGIGNDEAHRGAHAIPASSSQATTASRASSRRQQPMSKAGPGHQRRREQRHGGAQELMR
jgi:hypothetical protein